MSHALFSLPLSLSSFSFATGDKVKVQLQPSLQHVQGIFKGFTADGRGIVQLTGRYLVPYPPGHCEAFPLHWINAIQPRAQPKVGPVPVPLPVQVPVRPAPPRVEQPVPSPNPPPRVELPEEVQSILGDAASELFVSKAVYVSTHHAKLEEKMKRSPTGQYNVRVRCPAYAMANVEGKPMRASVAFTLSSRTAEIRTRLIEGLGFVPLGTYVRLTWDFERDANGKPFDKVGNVEILFRWGGEVPKKE